MKIRSYLAAIILSVLVPFTIFAGTIAYKLADGERAVAVDGLRSTARALAIAIDRYMSDVSDSLDVLAAAELLRLGELEGFHRYATRIVRTRPELHRLVLAAPSGRLLFDTEVPYGNGTRPTETINTASLDQAVATGRPIIGSDIFDDGQARAITVFVPARVNGQVKYVLIAFLDLSAISAVLADQKLPPDWTGSVLDGHGMIMGRSPSPDLFVGRFAPVSITSAVSRKTEGVTQYSTLDGRPTLAAFARSPLTGWTVVLGASVASAEFHAMRTLTIIILAGAALSLIALALAAFFGHQISRSVLGLLEPALAMASGTPINSAPASKITEIQYVSEKLKEASDVLSERERQRQQAEERYRLASLATNDFIWELDVQAGRAERSANFYSAFGYQSDAEMGTFDWWCDHLHPQDRERVITSVEALLASDRNSWSQEYRFRKADGTYAYVLDRAYCVRDDQGCVKRLVGAKIDLTAYKIVEEQLRRNEAHLARAQKLAAIGSWELDLESGEAHWSDETFRIFGVGRDTFKPAPGAFADFTLEQDISSVQGPVILAQQGHSPGPMDLSLDMRIRRADGAVRILRREGEAVVNSQGKLVGLIGTVQDVTDIRAAETKRLELEEQLRQTQKLEALGLLTGGIAHDFNNLLAVMVGNLELAVNRQKRGVLALDLDEASLKAAIRGAGLTRQLLSFARRQPLRSVCQDLRRIVEGMVPILESALTKKVTLELDLHSDPCWSEIDSGQFEAALLNLAFNARDAMPHGGTLTISVGPHEEGLVMQGANDSGNNLAGQSFIEVAVKDSGGGMTREVIARAFEPFFTTKDVGKGSGLGLSMVYGFVRQSGGRVHLESAPGQGTTVRLFFRRAEAPKSTPQAKNVPTIGVKELHVLLVEDEPAVRETVGAMLGDLGVSVIPVGDGLAALDILKSNQPVDMMVTDIIMPGGIDGIDLADAATMLRPGMRTAFMSGHAELDDRMLVSIKERPFLTKPLRKIELAAALGMLSS